MNKKFAILGAAFLLAGSVAAQSVVKGRVLDKNGQPIAGASVKAGSKVLAITDNDGQFTIANVPSGVNKLTVSYIGMESQTVNVSGNVSVTMVESDNSLDEVMVVAYGTAKKSSFTGSAAVIKSEDIAKVQTSNAVEAIKGKVSGVQMVQASGQPGAASPTIRVRGVSAILAGNDPLIIVDGTPYGGDLNNLNPQDIESLTVLKDAASNALYGARGANGVIMVTTKRSKERQGARVTLDAKWGVNTRAQQRYDYIDTPELYFETYYKALKNYAMTNNGLSEGEAHVWANKNLISGDFGLQYNPYTIPAGEYMIGANGRLNPGATMGNLVSYTDKNGKTDQYLIKADNWWNDIFKPSLRQEYNVSVVDGNERNNIYFSAGYLNNKGIVDNSNYERFVTRLKNELQVTPWLRMNVNMNYTHYKSNSMNDEGVSNSSGNVFAIANQIAPIFPIYLRNADGSIKVDANGLQRYDFGEGDNAGLIRNYLGKSNALFAARHDVNSSEGNAFTGVIGGEIRFTPHLRFSSTNSLALDETRGTSVGNPFYGASATSGGSVVKSHSRTLRTTYQQLLNYARTFNEVHNFEAMVGHESYYMRSYYVGASKTNMYSPYNYELDGAVIDGSPSSYVTAYNTEGWFSRVQYNFAEKYFGSVSFRRDASSRFHPEHRWGNFWSAGVAWNISKENFFQHENLSWIDQLKLKASFGQQGNDGIGNYRYTKTFSIVNVDGQPAATPSSLGKPEISWEKGTNFNAGVEFSLFKQRLSGQVEFFYRKTQDMLFSFPLAPSYGYTSYMANVGDMRNRGVEVELNAALIRTQDFAWNVNLNLTHYRNKITYLPEKRRTMNVDGYGGYSSGDQFFGQDLPIYTFYVKKYAGVDPQTGESLYWQEKTTKNAQGEEVKEMVKTKSYSDATYHLAGTALPDAYGGFGTSLSYKGFDLSVDFTYQLGGKVYDGAYAASMGSPKAGDNGGAIHRDVLDSWTPTNTGVSIPRFVMNDQYTNSSSDRFLTSASYLSLDRINFGYTLPSSVVSHLRLSSLRFYVSADNIVYWSKRKGLDPRQSLTGASNTTMYSPIRTVSAGVTVNF